MDAHRFDTLTRAFTAARSRRGALAALGGALGVLGWRAIEDADAHNALTACKKKSGEAKKKCLKKAKKHAATHVTAPPAASCVPNCSGKTCGGNGCGGSCGSCAAGEICAGNTCVIGQGTCPVNAVDSCGGTGTLPCNGESGCRCYRTLANDGIRCAEQGQAGPLNCDCTSDADCTRWGAGAFCSKGGPGQNCSQCDTGTGECRLPCRT